MTQPVPSERVVNDRNVIRRVLTTPLTWAVVGLSTDTSRTFIDA